MTQDNPPDVPESVTPSPTASTSSAPLPQPSSAPIGLARSEQAEVQAKFGVSVEQVRRDHLISHLLGALAGMGNKVDVIFFGRTALSRTLLPI